VYTLGLDTIAGAKLLKLKFGSAGAFQPDQAVMYGDRRARFIRASNGAAIIRRSGDSHPLAIPLETLSHPPEKQLEPRVTPRTQLPLSASRSLSRRSSRSAANWSLSPTAQRRVRII